MWSAGLVASNDADMMKEKNRSKDLRIDWKVVVVGLSTSLMLSNSRVFSILDCGQGIA